MLTIRAGSRRLCDGFTRRTLLTVGSAGLFGLGWPDLLTAAPRPTRAKGSFGRAKRCLLLFLTGGPPQHDTWDPKPDAPANIRGELKPIATSVPGIQFSELFPRLAAQARHLCVVRSVTHGDTVHTSAGYTMLTGMVHPKANAPEGAAIVGPGADDHPHLGSLLARFRPAPPELPAFVAVPEVVKDAAVNEFPGLNGGFMGRGFDPFLIEANAGKDGFRLPDIVLPPDVSADRLEDRRFLREKLERSLRLGDAVKFADLDGQYRRAFDVLASPATRRALDLDREPDRLRETYGRHLFGQGCLLARRLVEAGVGLVTVYWHYEGPDDSPVWDTHWNNYPHLRNRLAAPTDAAVAVLLDDLDRRGLLADTLVLVMGEFGRTPKINGKGGRDHWPHVQSILMAGAGITGGRVYGASDRQGAYPADQPVSPADLAATVLHLLGVSIDGQVQDRLGRPVPVCNGRPVTGLLA